MEQQEQILTKKRLIDLSRIADRKGAVTFSNFLNINEIDLFHQVLADIETGYRLSGGYEFAERQMIAFIPDALCYNEDAAEQEFPIVCLRFYPGAFCGGGGIEAPGNLYAVPGLQQMVRGAWENH